MRYLDDFAPGEILALGSFSFTEQEIIDFAVQFDPQPFHIDPQAAAKSIYGGIIASGWHTCGKMMRLVTDGLLNHSASMGSPGLDEVRWIKPVYPGDVLTMRYVVQEVRPSKSKPDRGIVLSLWQLHNQHGEQVCEIKTKGMFGRRVLV
jgi:acyl dehydratase